MCTPYREYGLKDTHPGVPVVPGKNRIEKIIELKPDRDEYTQLHRSARALREQIKNRMSPIFFLPVKCAAKPFDACTVPHSDSLPRIGFIIIS